MDKKIIGKCPLCGGNVVKTYKGWACENSLSEQQQCQFFLFSTIGNRRISDSEAAEFLSNKRILLDGFATKEGKCFTSVLTFNQDGTVNMDAKIGTCPKCGGQLYVGARSVSCANFKHPSNPCKFTIWRNTGGHDFSLNELDEIIQLGATNGSVTQYDAKGEPTECRLGLNSEKEVVRL